MRVSVAFSLIIITSCEPCDKVGEDRQLCVTHPFGPAAQCGAEEPQTSEACEQLLGANPGLCIHDYIICREALRIAVCGDCPAECDGIVGACAAVPVLDGEEVLSWRF